MKTRSNLRTWLGGWTLAGVLWTTVPFTSTPAVAAAKRPEERATVAERAARVREHVRKVAAELELTDAQIQALKVIFAKERQALRDLREDDTLTPRERLLEARAIRREVLEAIKGVLTAEQWEEWLELREEQRQNLRDRIERG
jgi:Spy/CpxP family protein refolding chaperone